MRVLRRALLLLGLLGGLLAMHGLAPAGGTDVLAAGPHEHPATLFAPAGPEHVLAAANSNPAVPDEGMPGHMMPASSGTPSPGHHDHGSHLDGLCLAVLAGGVAFLLILAVLGRRGIGRTPQALVPGLGHARALMSPLRPPDLTRLCVLRV